MNKTDFYQKHLNGVSRSFAFILAQLEQPQRDYISLSYLLFRLIDTVEDSRLPYKGKIGLLGQLNQVFDEKNEGTFDRKSFEVKKQLESVNLDCSPAELALVQDCDRLFTEYFQLPFEVKKIISDSLLTMIHGMSEHIQIFSSTPVNLKTESELNHYCFYVAGIIGEMLTRLMSYIYEKPEFIKSSLQNAVQFGLYLQKVNILKDKIEDAGRQVVYSESENELIHSMLGNLVSTNNYIKMIPNEWKDYKLFCLFSSGLGLISIIQKLTKHQLFKTREDVKGFFLFLKEKLNQKKDEDMFDFILAFLKLKKLDIPIVSLEKYVADLRDSLPLTESWKSHNTRYLLNKNYLGVMNQEQLSALFLNLTDS